MAKKSGLVSCADEDAKWRTESDLRTLLEAQKIEADPKRMKAVAVMAQEKMMEVAELAGKGNKS